MMKGKGGLGRGLDALIPSAPSAVVSRASEVDVEAIVPNPWQPRRNAEKTALAELADSIRQYGLLQPLVVTATADGLYQLIAGERRWQAAKMAGLQSVPVIVREATPQEALELALIENIQRADLNPLEEAAAYRRLTDEFGLTQEQVAQRVGKGRVSVANSLRLLGLPPEAKEALATGEITEGHARAILRVTDVPGQLLVLHTIMEKGLSVRQAEEFARRLAEDLARVPRPGRAPSQKNAETAALEQDLIRALGTKVELFQSRKGGKVVIHFFSEEEFNSLYERLVPPT
ncbi:MAG: ParB/RepB/Spo0J family partition protein [Dehalococcoidales bacterium]|nr:ParB/RepB/Spo0J family partition protein [Dehalococcoidales bacterium]